MYRLAHSFAAHLHHDDRIIRSHEPAPAFTDALYARYPMYTVTMRQQARARQARQNNVAHKDAASVATTDAFTPSPSALDVARLIVKEEGWRGLFKGLQAALVANGAQEAIYCG